MNISLKNIKILAFIAIFLSLSNSYAQTESAKIDNLIEQKRAFNKKNKNLGGFKIQIYNGIESQAYKIEQESKANFPEYMTSTKYKAPEWKTQIGPFKTRLEADRTLLIIKKKYAGAIVIEEKV
jgi:hypothetical protein